MSNVLRTNGLFTIVNPANDVPNSGYTNAGNAADVRSVNVVPSYTYGYEVPVSIIVYIPYVINLTLDVVTTLPMSVTVTGDAE